MSLHFAPEAREDIVCAAEYYEDCEDGLSGQKKSVPVFRSFDIPHLVTRPHRARLGGEYDFALIANSPKLPTAELVSVEA